jgi:hypothetical protein|tara:strand:- start:2550 stop:3677 length:1128 start_codon:yes stop_codon:yes gene_type:complete
MDEEIVLDRGNTNIMKLDADEQAIMDEIEISAPRPQRVPRPARPSPNPPLMTQQQESMDAFVNPNKQSAPVQYQQDEEIDYGEDEMYDDQDMDTGPGPSHQEEQPTKGYTSIDEEKADLINKLSRLEKKGFAVNKRLNAYSNVEELRSEVKRITYSIDVEQSVRFSRRMLVACVTGLEFLNKRYNPFEVQLEGWSESIMENVDDYDGVFEELYVKYRSKVSVAPEIKLIMMLGGSAMMFHLTNSMFKSVMPNMNDVMKQNPDLIKSMMSAVQNTTRNTGGPADTAPVGGSGEYQMQGPGIDISSLMGGIMMPPTPPMNTTKHTLHETQDEDEDDISDIISISGDSTGGEVKEVNVATTRSKRAPRQKKTKKEINL